MSTKFGARGIPPHSCERRQLLVLDQDHLHPHFFSKVCGRGCCLYYLYLTLKIEEEAVRRPDCRILDVHQYLVFQSAWWFILLYRLVLWDRQPAGTELGVNILSGGICHWAIDIRANERAFRPQKAITIRRWAVLCDVVGLHFQPHLYGPFGLPLLRGYGRLCANLRHWWSLCRYIPGSSFTWHRYGCLYHRQSRWIRLL
jgi:hypothetical protein